MKFALKLSKSHTANKDVVIALMDLLAVAGKDESHEIRILPADAEVTEGYLPFPLAVQESS
jgi:hypothetical protein